MQITVTVIVLTICGLLALNSWVHSPDYDFLSRFGAREPRPHDNCGTRLGREYELTASWPELTKAATTELRSKGWRFLNEDKDGVRFTRGDEFLQLIPAQGPFPIEVVVSQQQPALRKFCFGLHGLGWGCSNP